MNTFLNFAVLTIITLSSFLTPVYNVNCDEFIFEIVNVYDANTNETFVLYNWRHDNTLSTVEHKYFINGSLVYTYNSTNIKTFSVPYKLIRKNSIASMELNIENIKCYYSVNLESQQIYTINKLVYFPYIVR